MRNFSERRGLARFTDYTPAVAMLSLISALLLAGPLRGQELTGPFASVQRNLDLAADAQLAFARTPNPPVANALPNAAPRTLKQPRPIEPPAGKPLSTRMDSEQRFRALGLDAEKIFNEVGVPIELLGVAKVESDFNPFAVSPKGALGLWQLMPATARRYGLHVDPARDERLDAEKSSRAALRYLRDLHAQFGNWALALAAYNAGEDVVERAIKRTKTRSFNLVAQAGMLPLETRNYVLAVLSAMGAIRGINARYVATGTRQSATAAIVYAAEYAEN